MILQKTHKQKGIALVMSLLIIIILVVVVNQLSYSSRVDVFVAENYHADLQNRYGLLATLDFAIAYLKIDQRKSSLEEEQKSSLENDGNTPPDRNNRGTRGDDPPFKNDNNGKNEDTASVSKNESYDCLTDLWAQGIQVVQEKNIEIASLPLELYQKKLSQPPDPENSKTMVYYTIVDENSKFDLLRFIQKPKKKEKKDSEKKEEGNKDSGEKENGEKPGEGDGKKEGEAPEKKKPLSTSDQFSLLVSAVQGKDAPLSGADFEKTVVKWMKSKEGKYKESFAKKIPIFSLKEILLAEKIDRAVLYGFQKKKKFIPGLANYLTVWSDGLVNINTASPIVLQSLSKKIDRKMAQVIVNYRNQVGENGEKRVFKSKAELKDKVLEPLKKQDPSLDIFDEISDLVTVRSSYFSLRAFAETGRLRKKIHAILFRKDKQVYKLYCEFED